MVSMPVWNIPEDLQDQLNADEGGIWQDTRWAPILLTVMKGTTYGGRDIPLAWQIEFEPDDKLFEAANHKIQNLGVDPDGYGWANVLSSVAEKHHPEIVSEMRFGDTESSTCVVWVESEAACELLTRLAWSLIHGS